MKRPLPLILLLALPVAAQDFSLRLPLACEPGRSCFVQHYVDHDASAAARDFQCGSLTYDGHDGTDIRLPDLRAQRGGVDVLAAADGTVRSTRDGVPDRFLRQEDREQTSAIGCGNGVVIEHGSGWRTVYCHLARGSVAVRSGQAVRAGERLGRVGLSGLTEFPHLHFTVRKDGRVVDPFAYGAPASSCGGGQSLWEPSAQAALAYRAGTVLNAGFAPGPVGMEAIESGAVQQEGLTTRSPALVAFVRAIGLRSGDIQTLTLADPEGRTLARQDTPALDRDKAQWMTFAGVRRPEGGFRPGTYTARYRVERGGQAVIEREFGIRLGP